MHEFLDYQEIDIHFIYSFLWNCASSTSVASTENQGFPHEVFTSEKIFDNLDPEWSNPLIHERILTQPCASQDSSTTREKAEELLSSYQPTFAVQRRTLEKYQSLNNDTTCYLVVPFHFDADLSPPSEPPEVVGIFDEENRRAIIELEISWTIRIFDTGCGSITCSVKNKSLDEFDRETRYKLIHWILHLASNVDRHPEGHPSPEDTRARGENEQSDSFLWLFNLPDWMKELVGSRFDNHSRIFRLNDIVQLALERLSSEPIKFCDDRHCTILIDQEFTARGELFQARESQDSTLTDRPPFKYKDQVWDEPQSPLIFSALELSPASYTELNACVSDQRSKEVAAILTKITLRNSTVSKDFQHLNKDYLNKYLQTTKEGRLENMCLDDRVFFSLSRRGAISIFSDDLRGPAYFVVPSLLNLCEILRTQLHAATSLNWHLARITHNAATAKGRSVIEFRKYSQLRKQYVMNLQNPITHLFDGGSVTEIAELAENIWLIKQAWSQVSQSFDAIDRLVNTLGIIQMDDLME